MEKQERRLRDGVTPGSTIILPRTSRIRKITGPHRQAPSRRWLWFALGILIPVLAVAFQLRAIATAIVANDPRHERQSRWLHCAVYWGGRTCWIW